MREKTLNTQTITLESLNCKKELTDLLYHLYKTDISFPRSCGSVSMAMALILHNTDIKEEYDITYIRGHFRNDNEYEDCYCDVAELDFDRFSGINNFECLKCNYDYMIGHSWIELANKITKENIILDFTSIQLEEDFCDYHSDILESDFNKEELFDYLQKRSKFIVFSSDLRYRKYIKSERELDGECILSKTKETISEDCVSDLTILLDAINYKL